MGAHEVVMPMEALAFTPVMGKEVGGRETGFYAYLIHILKPPKQCSDPPA
jgi:hypothetical protein